MTIDDFSDRFLKPQAVIQQLQLEQAELTEILEGLALIEQALSNKPCP